jgi:hypothetical protein
MAIGIVLNKLGVFQGFFKDDLSYNYGDAISRMTTSTGEIVGPGDVDYAEGQVVIVVLRELGDLVVCPSADDCDTRNCEHREPHHSGSGCRSNCLYTSESCCNAELVEIMRRVAAVKLEL